MSDPITLQMAQRGVLTLPKGLRQAYKLEAGDTLTLIDLGGVFVLSPRRAELDRLADQIAGDLAQRGESLESMLLALREVREQYGRPD
ncbi:MAG TPA: AbrB/MazE/SpoVT family DNA-binding domain-containing protein [Anaerolineaceae bacterium]|nr:AbrB/MazE/SpoVT family DNA-binding domain-containing protein [Anaerolineaceae bacterium]